MLNVKVTKMKVRCCLNKNDDLILLHKRQQNMEQLFYVIFVTLYINDSTEKVLVTFF